MDNMLALLGNHRPCFIFRELFLQQLPAPVRSALANSPVKDFRKLAREADEFHLAACSSPAFTPLTAAVQPILNATAQTRLALPHATQQQMPGLCYYHSRFGKKCHPPCTFSKAGNTEAHSVATVNTGHKNSLLYITDTLSGRHFLCDTGAQVSVLPASLTDIQSGNRGPSLEAVNASRIQILGERHAELCFSGWRFVWRPLLGADFFCAKELLVDIRNRRLVDAEDFVSLPSTLSIFPTTTLSSKLTALCDFARLLGEFPELTKPTFSIADMKHGLEHHIPTSDPPVHAHARARRLDPVKLAIAEAEFKNMERLGIVRRSNSP